MPHPSNFFGSLSVEATYVDVSGLSYFGFLRIFSNDGSESAPSFQRLSIALACCPKGIRSDEGGGVLDWEINDVGSSDGEMGEILGGCCEQTGKSTFLEVLGANEIDGSSYSERLPIDLASCPKSIRSYEGGCVLDTEINDVGSSGGEMGKTYLQVKLNMFKLNEIILST